MKLPISDRLLACAGFVKKGDRVADIGCDHGYLSIHLLANGIASRCIAADINEGPLKSARVHIAENGLSNRVTLVLTDGLIGLEECGITDIAICGMGGELIADIISRAPFTKDKSIRLVLQPMTRAAHLRYFLAREGFTVTDEAYAREGKRAYLIIACSYTGKAEGTGTPECLFGKAIYEYAEEEATYLRAKLSSLKN
jgi:tRNA (adenine22-N1)-methyltransferase